MTDERMTAAAIVAERPDMQPTGEFYLELAMTGAVVAAVTPHGRRAVAGFLRAICARAPMSTADAYEPHRSILGALISELETAAVVEALDHPEPDLVDLRDPAIRDRERTLIRETRDWAAGERSRATDAYREHVDELVEQGTTDHQAAQRRLDASVAEAEAFLAGSAPAADDASAWLA